VLISHLKWTVHEGSNEQQPFILRKSLRIRYKHPLDFLCCAEHKKLVLLPIRKISHANSRKIPWNGRRGENFYGWADPNNGMARFIQIAQKCFDPQTPKIFVSSAKSASQWTLLSLYVFIIVWTLSQQRLNHNFTKRGYYRGYESLTVDDYTFTPRSLAIMMACSELEFDADPVAIVRRVYVDWIEKLTGTFLQTQIKKPKHFLQSGGQKTYANVGRMANLEHLSFESKTLSKRLYWQ